MKAQWLGQSGVRLSTAAGTLYVDPYLSDSVERLEGPGARRLRPAPCRPSEVRDADWVLVTHEHVDHFDPDTLGPLASASPRSRLVAPAHLRGPADGLGFRGDRFVAAPRQWLALGPSTRVHAVAASHPEPRADADGNPWACAYVVEEKGTRLLFTGDTSLTDDLLRGLEPFAPFGTVFLPVNERNHMKESAGIVGNMTLREAFHLATRLQAKALVPQHYDMFRANSVHAEEIRLLHDLERPPFALVLEPGVLA